MLNPLITLTTDFGTADWFVGSMKGIMTGICPKALILDITHDIPAGNVRAAAFALAASYRYFPRNTVHLAVVDPGVGSQRAALAVHTADYYFVGPDNGLLSFALKREKILDVRVIENDTLFHKPVSQTFHGRDIFAPVAAHLAHGIEMRALGRVPKDYDALVWPQPRPTDDGGLLGEIVYIDHFGNAITNIDAGTLQKLGNDPLQIWLGDQPIAKILTHYQAAPAGNALGIVGSSGYLEIAINGGHATQAFQLKVGDPVSLYLAAE